MNSVKYRLLPDETDSMEGLDWNHNLCKQSSQQELQVRTWSQRVLKLGRATRSHLTRAAQPKRLVCLPSGPEAVHAR